MGDRRTRRMAPAARRCGRDLRCRAPLPVTLSIPSISGTPAPPAARLVTIVTTRPPLRPFTDLIDDLHIARRQRLPGQRRLISSSPRFGVASQQRFG